MQMAGAHCSHSPWAVPFTGETGTGIAHSVSFVWKLCAVRIILFQTYIGYIFVFGYHLRRDFAATLVCTIPNMDGHKWKENRLSCTVSSKGPSQAFDFSFTSRWGGHQIWIFTLIWHGLNCMPSSVITLAFQYSRDMLSIQILIGNSGPKVQWWINHK